MRSLLHVSLPEGAALGTVYYLTPPPPQPLHLEALMIVQVTLSISMSTPSPYPAAPKYQSSITLFAAGLKSASTEVTAEAVNDHELMRSRSG